MNYKQSDKAQLLLQTSIAGEETRERRVDGIDAVASALQQCASLCHSRDTSILNSELQSAFNVLYFSAASRKQHLHL